MKLLTHGGFRQETPVAIEVLLCLLLFFDVGSPVSIFSNDCEVTSLYFDVDLLGSAIRNVFIF
jgi:hypothetical protein